MALDSWEIRQNSASDCGGDIGLSTRIRQAWLEVLRALGTERFISTSGFGMPFVCHMGDFVGENAFYNRRALAPELRLAEAWLQLESKPVVIDVGANVGYWSTQLAQLILSLNPKLYSFEPAPDAYCKLVKSVEMLGLSQIISPIGVAISDAPAIVSLSFNPKDSGYGQMGNGALNMRAGDRLAQVVSITLDHFVESLNLRPHLVKIDVEGNEIRVLKGATSLLSGASKPALTFELFPLALAETNSDRSEFGELLQGYDLYYIDDFEGQRREFGSPIGDLAAIDWTCNIFAAPAVEGSHDRFRAAAASARAKLSAA